MTDPRYGPRCAVMGCARTADTVIEGDDRLTGEPLPTVYACDDPRHQYHAALAIMPPGTIAPRASFGEAVQAALGEWNAAEARRIR